MRRLEREADRLALGVAAIGHHVRDLVRNVGSGAGPFGRVTVRLGVVAAMGVLGILGCCSTGTIGAVVGVHVVNRCSAIAVAAAVGEISIWRRGVVDWTLPFPVVVVIVA